VRPARFDITRRPPRWWKEPLIIAAFYGIYSYARNQFGSANLAAGAEPTGAFDNAQRVIHWERSLGLFRERTVQGWFLGWHWFLRFWNVFYGSAHFVVTIAAFVWLYKRARGRFARWRNALAFTTALAIVGFSLFPVMPPRLLDDTGRFGGARLVAERNQTPSGFVDTLKRDGGLWNFDSGAMTRLSNQYAAMPSLHTAWSTWCAFVMWPLTRRRWARALTVLYPLATVFCIVLTANHYWIDGVGGVLALGVGVVLGRALDHWNQSRHAGRPTPSSAVPSDIVSLP
jgi:PAP2 superfamily